MAVDVIRCESKDTGMRFNKGRRVWRGRGDFEVWVFPDDKGSNKRLKFLISRASFRDWQLQIASLAISVQWSLLLL